MVRIITVSTLEKVHNIGISNIAYNNCFTFLSSIINKQTFGPSPHLRGYVSLSMITLFILATMPWSHVAITAVVI